MKKLAIVACLNSNAVCAGCACLNAFNDRRKSFERYAGEELRLMAYMRCSRCHREDGDPLTDPGFVEKLDRLVSEGVEIAHIGICAGRDPSTACPAMLKMAGAMRERSIEVIWGTH